MFVNIHKVDGDSFYRVKCFRVIREYFSNIADRIYVDLAAPLITGSTRRSRHSGERHLRKLGQRLLGFALERLECL